MLRRLLALILLLFAFGAQAEKPGLVLLNIQGPEIADHDRDQYRAVLAKALGQKYTVYSGADVDKKLAKTAKKVCDDVKCLQDVAIAYQATLIGRGVVVREQNGYSVTVEIRDIFSDRVELSETAPCRFCDKFQIFETLQRVAGGSPAPRAVPQAAMEVEELTPQVSEVGGSNQAILIVDSVPAKADVWLGDRKVGQTPYQNTGFRPGERVVVTLRAEGHKDKAIAVTLKGGFNHLKGIKLDQSQGTIMVTTQPFASGAQIWVNGKVGGNVPGVLTLPAGNYRIQIRGALSGEQVVDLADGQSITAIIPIAAPEGRTPVAIPLHGDVRFLDNGDGTVTDVKTGLMWQRCGIGQRWSDGKCAGQLERLQWNRASARTSDAAGHKDWRLPTLEELQSIVHCSGGVSASGTCLGGSTPPTVVAGVFPAAEAGQYWTRDARAMAAGHQVWVVNFENGSSRVVDDYNFNHAFLVRGTADKPVAETPKGAVLAGRYVDPGDATIFDSTTNLMWQRCSVGQRWNGTTCEGSAERFQWNRASGLGSILAGHKDWRLPTLEELQSLVRCGGAEAGDFGSGGCKGTPKPPTLMTSVFPGTSAGAYWTRDGIPRAAGYSVWMVDFGRGDWRQTDEYEFQHVRLVRKVQGQDSRVMEVRGDMLGERYADPGDGTVTDVKTGLVWQRCSVGQAWTGKACAGEADLYFWEQATRLSGEFAGHSDWRLPKLEELEGIVSCSVETPAARIGMVGCKAGSARPTVFAEAFPGAVAAPYWSADSSGTSVPPRPWQVDFERGRTQAADAFARAHARLVRKAAPR